MASPTAEKEANDVDRTDGSHPTPITDGYSLEMTAKDVQNLRDAAPVMRQGGKVNLTYLANENLEMRIEAAREVTALGFQPVPHIAARRLGSDRDLEEFLDRLRDAGASRSVFVVGGDPSTPMGPYPDALSVIRAGVLEKYGVEEVSIAGYPEGHPDIDSKTLWRHLADKSAALADQGLRSVILTQFAFDTDPVTAWVADVRRRGITSEIRIGTPGPAGIKRLLAFATRFGVGANASIVKKYGFSLTNLLGTAGPDRFVDALASDLRADVDTGGIRLHFYAFGGLRATAEWASAYHSSRSDVRS